MIQISTYHCIELFPSHVLSDFYDTLPTVISFFLLTDLNNGFAAATCQKSPAFCSLLCTVEMDIGPDLVLLVSKAN